MNETKPAELEKPEVDDKVYTPEQKEIHRLHEENKERRLKAKELQIELEKLQAEKKEYDENKMKADGKLQELIQAKEKEIETLKPLKTENEKYIEFFKSQLEVALKKLPKDQIELINESEMSIAKKLEWALKLGNNGLSKSDSPDSRRPGGDVPMPDIKLEDYSGPEGRIKLLKLQDSNPKLYERILELKNIKT